jgi:hypothetical protein
MRIAAVARRRESRLDLLNRQLRHPGIAAPFREQHQGDTLIAGALGPLERHALAGIFLQGLAKGGNGLLEPRRPALPLAEHSERVAEIRLGLGPLEPHALAGPFLQGLAIGGKGLIEPRRPALPLAKRSKRIAEIVLGRGPLERRARVNSCKASRSAATASASRAVPLSRSPSLSSALPRFTWAPAHRSGTRPRVSSFNASR